MTDLISRQAAIDALLHNQEVYSNNFGTDAIDKYTIAIIANDVQTIVQLPSVQRTGRWIYNDEAYPGGNPYGHYECDQCGEYVPHKTNYCPNCGCAMKGEEE